MNSSDTAPTTLADSPGHAAVLGLGIIGSRVATRLANSGWQVTCWNRSPKGMPGEATTPAARIPATTARETGVEILKITKVSQPRIILIAMKSSTNTRLTLRYRNLPISAASAK